MRNTAMSYKAGLVLIALSVLFACSQKKNPADSLLDYHFESSQTGCKQVVGKIVEVSGSASIIFSSFNDAIRIVHANAHYNCCAEIETNVSRTVNGFDVFEIDQGDSCDCMCYVDITTLICNLSAGTYLIRVFDTSRSLVGHGYLEVRPGDPGGPSW